MEDTIPHTFGNAQRDSRRGWFIGQFVEAEGGLRKRDDVEIKWGVHPAGEERSVPWVAYRTSTSIPILISGECLIELRHGEARTRVRLAAPGDYVIVPPLVEHGWRAVTDCIVLTVRCPSVPDDLVESSG